MEHNHMTSIIIIVFFFLMLFKQFSEAHELTIN